MMQIIIPTRGRTGQQLTLHSLPGELRKRTTLVCPKREASSLYRLYNDLGVKILIEPYPMKLAQKRGWIVQTWFSCGYDKIIMLDDDLTFATRKSKSLPKSTDEELIAAFQHIEDKLGQEFSHAGLGQRQFNNHIAEVGWKIPGKMQCALGYYLPVVAREVRWDLVELRQDYCASLQLLLKGYANAVWTETVVEQARGFDAPGGCNTYRTPEMIHDEAEKFAELFPNYVSVGKRKYGRLEVTVQWKKALDDGLKQNRKGVYS
jgi:hypothetical protein